MTSISIGGVWCWRHSRRGEPSQPFRFVDKSNLATVGRAHAVAEIKGIQTSGMLAWMTWLGNHIYYLIGLQNRLLALTRWTFSFVTRGRGGRLITGEPVPTTEEVGGDERRRRFDPEHRSFDSPEHPLLRDAVTNPSGVRHIDETAQDQIPKVQ